MRIRVAIALLLLFVIATGPFFGQSLQEQDSVAKQATAPADTTLLWLDSDNGRLYTYRGGEWLGEAQSFVFGKGAADVTGALNICGAVSAPCDTTTDAEQGYYLPDRMRITQITALCNDAAPACTLQVFSDRLAYKYVWDGTKENFAGGATDTVAAGDVLTSYILAGAAPQNPDSLTVVVTVRERVAAS